MWIFAVFLALYDGFTKQAIWRRHLELWEQFSGIYRPKEQSLNQDNNQQIIR